MLRTFAFSWFCSTSACCLLFTNRYSLYKLHTDHTENIFHSWFLLLQRTQLKVVYMSLHRNDNYSIVAWLWPSTFQYISYDVLNNILPDSQLSRFAQFEAWRCPWPRDPNQRVNLLSWARAVVRGRQSLISITFPVNILYNVFTKMLALWIHTKHKASSWTLLLSKDGEQRPPCPTRCYVHATVWYCGARHYP
jgi:hypothetical protein